VKLLSEGYMAIAAESGGNISSETPPAFTAVLAKLDALASDDAMEFRTQLKIARQVFNHL
jgi:hypothetical protein